MSLATIITLVLAFKIAILFIILLNIILEKRINIRVRQNYILDNLMN